MIKNRIVTYICSLEPTEDSLRPLKPLTCKNATTSTNNCIHMRMIDVHIMRSIAI